MEKAQQAISPTELSTMAPTDPMRIRGRPKKQKEAETRPEMARSGISQWDDERQKETPSHNKDGSLASSTQSAHSPSSFGFSKLDRLGQSSIAPGILRLGPRSASQNGQRSLPDEKGFSVQIGSELFKLSGASIMSDGRFGDIWYIDHRLKVLEHPHTFLLSSLNSLSRMMIA